MYVCVCVLYICACVCMYVCMYTCVYVCVRVHCTYVCVCSPSGLPNRLIFHISRGQEGQESARLCPGLVSSPRHSLSPPKLSALSPSSLQQAGAPVSARRALTTRWLLSGAAEAYVLALATSTLPEFNHQRPPPPIPCSFALRRCSADLSAWRFKHTPELTYNLLTTRESDG